MMTMMMMMITERELQRQELLDYVSEFVEVSYVQTECRTGVEHHDTASPPHHIRLMNSGSRPVVGGGWTIYFNHAAGLQEMSYDYDSDLVARHVDGWLFTLTLRAGRVLPPLSNVTLPNAVRLASRCYAFPRWYVVIMWFCHARQGCRNNHSNNNIIINNS